jgi:hypothetical protein
MLVSFSVSWFSFWMLLFVTRHRGSQAVQLVNDRIYFQATSVEATFRDQSHHVFDDESIHFNSTVIGDLISFSYQDESFQLREVRLYFIPPELDWRVNQTFQWKLTQSWIYDTFYDWIFWNVNGFVNSNLRARDDRLFQCEHVEFTYWHNAPRGYSAESEGRLVMKNVEMGAFLSLGFNESSVTRYNPCGKEPCRAVDGLVTCGTQNYWRHGAIGISSLVISVMIVAIVCRTKSRTRQYSVLGNAEQNGRSDDDRSRAGR